MTEDSGVKLLEDRTACRVLHTQPIVERCFFRSGPATATRTPSDKDDKFLQRRKTTLTQSTSPEKLSRAPILPAMKAIMEGAYPSNRGR